MRLKSESVFHRHIRHQEHTPVGTGGIDRMAHTHSHGGATGRYLGLSIALTLAFVAGEAAAGWYANSLALLADSGHNLADALALVFSWYAIRLARRPPDV